MTTATDTGYYNYTTHDDGLCEFNTAEDAISTAKAAAKRSGEQIAVYDPQGEKYFTARPDLPTHQDRCEQPDIHGYED